MADVLDLDALAPKPRTIKFGGDEIQVKPPKTKHVLRLGALGQKMQEIAELKPEEVDKLVEDMTAELAEVVPEVKDKSLTTAQLMALLELVVEMGMPKQAEELKKRNISLSPTSDSEGDSQKKA